MSRKFSLFRGRKHSKGDEAAEAKLPDSEPDEPWGFLELNKGSNPDLDIIAIHGLDGHREKTWTHENGTMWLKDLIGEVIGNARILSYGYDARTHTSRGYTSVQTLQGHSKEFLQQLSDLREVTQTTRRPIIFVAHSLGGIILKGALVHAQMSDKPNQKNLKAVKISTYGIIFLGTPHEGSRIANLAQCVLQIAKIYYSTTNILVRELEEHSSSLEGESSRFNHIQNSFVIRNCYESYPTHLMAGNKMVVVPKWSAAPPSWDTTAVEIMRDHISMGKFRSNTDNEYLKISRALLILSQSAANHIELAWEQQNSLEVASASKPVKTMSDLQELFLKTGFAIRTDLPLRNGAFTGRSSLLREINEYFHGSNGEWLIMLCGPRGIGKTELILRYAWESKSEYTAVFWLNASTLSALQMSFLAIANSIIAHYRKHLADHDVPIGLLAQYLELKDLTNHEGTITAVGEDALNSVITAVKLWLDLDGNGRWLMIYDSYEPESFPLESYLPSTSSGYVAVTTCRKFSLSIGFAINIPEFSADESLELLKKRSQRVIQPTAQEDESCKQIVESLGYFPLAIDHAAAYIKHEDVSFSYYRQQMQDQTSYLLRKRPHSVISRYDESVFTTWDRSYSLLERKHSEAARLLAVCSYFFNDDLPLDLFLRGRKEHNDKIDELFSILLSYFMVKRARDDSFKIHTLVHIWARERFEQSMQKAHIQEALQIMADAVRPENELQRTTKDWIFERRIRTHIIAATSAVEAFNDGKGHNEVDPSIWVDLADISRFHGRYQDSEQLYQRGLHGRDPLADSAAPGTLDIGLKMARLYRAQERLDLAIPLFKRYLASAESTGSDTELRVPRAQIALAVALHKTGKHTEGESLLRQGICTLEDQLGRDNVEALLAKDSLANNLVRQQKYDEAEALYVEILDKLRIVLPSGDLITLRTMQNLARLYNIRSEYEKARVMLEEVLMVREAILSLENPSTLRTWHNLAWVYWSSGDLEAAENMYTGVVISKEKVLGPCSIDTVAAKRELAAVYRDRRETKRARDMLQATLDSLDKTEDARLQKEISKMQEQLSALSHTEAPDDEKPTT